MKKHVVIVHGFTAKPGTNWKPWLKRELEAKGFEVDVPAMPDTEHPIASEWTAELAKIVVKPSRNTYLVGHSLGCITILRYLETLAEGQNVGGIVLVAGFGERFQKYKSGSHDTFFDHKLNWSHIREHCSNIVAIHSDDDPGVGTEQLSLFKDRLGAKAIMVHGMGHFSSADGVFEVPLVRDELLTMVAHQPLSNQDQ